MNSIFTCDQSQGLLTVDDANARMLAQLPTALATENVDLVEAEGRILASNVAAQFDVPAWDNSAMDGYALRAAEAGKGGRFLIAGRIAAGACGNPLVDETAVRIFTGAPLPEGADAVVAQEDCIVEGRHVFVPPASAGSHIRRRGEEMRHGDRLLSAGVRLRAQDIGLLASHGVNHVPVRRKLRVALLSSGDELREPGESIGPGQIYNANRYTLRALLRGWGCEVQDLGVMPDDLALTRDALQLAAQNADVIITSGGVSVGEEDHIKQAVRELGELDLWKLAIQPGKPLAFGKVQGTPWIGLPGNPVAVLVTVLMVARPWLWQAQGRTARELHPLVVPCGFEWPKARARRQFLRARLEVDPEGMRAVLHPNQGSAMLGAASWADGLVDIEPSRLLDRSEPIGYWPFSELLW